MSIFCMAKGMWNNREFICTCCTKYYDEETLITIFRNNYLYWTDNISSTNPNIPIMESIFYRELYSKMDVKNLLPYIYKLSKINRITRSVEKTKIKPIHITNPRLIRKKIQNGKFLVCNNQNGCEQYNSYIITFKNGLKKSLCSRCHCIVMTKHTTE